MKIIHIAESFVAGCFDFVVELTNGLPNYKHIIIHGKRETTPSNFRDYFPANTEFLYWKNATREINPKRDLYSLIHIINILRKYKADVIHLHSSKAGFIGRLAAWILNIQCKVIYTPHGVSFLRKDVSNFKHKLFIYLEKFGYKFGGKIIACSKSEAEEYWKYGIKADYIYNGIRCMPSNFTRETNQKITIGTVGRITAAKNPVLFNKIAEKLNVKFLWIGDGELKSELTAKNIEISGWIERKNIEAYLKKIDIYLSTSLWEGLPLSVLQAMCHAKPLVLSDCVGNRDLVKADYNGFIFSSIEEAIKYLNILIKNQNKITEFGNHSQMMVKDIYSLENMLKQYDSLYQNLNTNKHL
jgi:glycosyltransferase involved in cell wall biosynthesis